MHYYFKVNSGEVYVKSFNNFEEFCHYLSGLMVGIIQSGCKPIAMDINIQTEQRNDT